MRLGYETPAGFLTEAELRATDFAATLPSLAFCDLTGADLARLDLRAVDFTGADLRWADLRDSDLRGASMNLARLEGAKLGGALVTGVAWPVTHPEPLVRLIRGYATMDRQVV